ncbi:hypothetical protein HDU96_003385 [Phlyctochytrium bullatum]|nr:hypothetical protein HDU96_003385 [Phlyctochytrium bullatum]
MPSTQPTEPTAVHSQTSPAVENLKYPFVQQRSAVPPNAASTLVSAFPKDAYGPVARATTSITTFQAIILVFLAIMTGVQIQSFMSRGDSLDITKFLVAQNIIGSNSDRSPLESNITATPPPVQAAPASAATPFPSALNRRFSNSDLESFFTVKYIPRTEVDPAVAPFVEAHDVTTDELYTQDPEAAERWKQSLEWYLEQPVKDDKRFYVKFVSKEKGYGMFAAYDITKNSIISVYSGVLTNNSVSDYIWSYPSTIYDDKGENLNLGIDARFKGNWARFVNHEDSPNTEAVYVIYNNLWHVVYVATDFIARGQEVTVSYGPDYWASRESPILSTETEEAADE